MRLAHRRRINSGAGTHEIRIMTERPGVRAVEAALPRQPYRQTQPARTGFRVPPIHRREPVSMGYMAHAFRDVLPRSGALRFRRTGRVAPLDSRRMPAEQPCATTGVSSFAGAARFELPDSVSLTFSCRDLPRRVLDVPISDQVVYNTCSPFFYLHHAYRDQAYSSTHLIWRI